MNRTSMIVLSSTTLIVFTANAMAFAAKLPVTQEFQTISFTKPSSEDSWFVPMHERRIKGIRLTQYQERFAPLDFDPANPEKSQPKESAKSPIWPVPLIKKPAPASAPMPSTVPASRPAPAASAPAKVPAPGTAPGYYPSAAGPQPHAAYAPPAVYAPLPGQPAQSGVNPSYGSGGYIQPGYGFQPGTAMSGNQPYMPGAYNPWGAMPPPPAPETDWGNNPFGPPVTRDSAGNSWSMGARSTNSATGAAHQAPAYGYAPPGWGYNFAPPDPIGRDAKNDEKSRPAYPYPGAVPPGYGWPGIPPYPGF